MNRTLRAVASISWATLMIAGCSADRANSPGGSAPLAPGNAAIPMLTAPPSFPTSPSSWVSGLSNPYLGFQLGRVFQYRAETPEGVETTVIDVTRDTRTIQGVLTTVVHDQVSLDGSLIEDTFDWYAQDTDGNVWYFGEDSKQIDHGVVIGTEGSWEAGVNGAEAGIVMLAEPKVGMKYRQEYLAGVAEDIARVQSLSRSVQVPYGSFDNCLQTFEWTPLDRSVREYKYYALGVGLVLTTEDKGRVLDQLVSVKH
jgi:hypothetical protein